MKAGFSTSSQMNNLLKTKAIKPAIWIFKANGLLQIRIRSKLTKKSTKFVRIGSIDTLLAETSMHFYFVVLWAASPATSNYLGKVKKFTERLGTISVYFLGLDMHHLDSLTGEQPVYYDVATCLIMVDAVFELIPDIINNLDPDPFFSFYGNLS